MTDGRVPDHVADEIAGVMTRYLEHDPEKDSIPVDRVDLRSWRNQLRGDDD